MVTAAAFMASWVSAALGADRKPMERKVVLLLTIVPVIVGLDLSSIYPVTSGFIRCTERGADVDHADVTPGPLWVQLLENDTVAWKREKFLVGIWFGLGLRRTIRKGKVGFQLLGNLSLTDMNRETAPWGYIRPLTVTASAVYQISLGEK